MQAELIEDDLKSFAVFGCVDHVRRGADDLHASRFESLRQIERCLSAELHDHAVGIHAVADVEHVLGRQRFEEQQVRRVVVGADGFRIRVDHDRFDAQLPQREAGVTAAVIELDPLPDAIRAAAENHDPLLARLLGGVSSSDS